MLFALPDDQTAADDATASVQQLLKDKPAYDAMAKVELDLEDAPFMAEEEAPAPEKAAPDSSQPVSIGAPGDDEKKEKKGGALKKFLAPKISIPVFALIAAGVGAYVYFFHGSAPVEETPPEPQVIDLIDEPESVEEPQGPEEFRISFDPFWVEQTDNDGQTRFLIFKFSATGPEEKVQWEAAQKVLLLRDAVFYYLQHKNLTFLSSPDNAAVMKRDLLGILNGQLSLGRLEDLHIESYLVK